MTQARWLMLIGFAVVLAGTLLSLRHQRLRVMHDTIELHGQIDQTRQALWDLQVRTAEQANLQELHEAIRSTDLELSPMVFDEPIAGAPTPQDEHVPTPH